MYAPPVEAGRGASWPCLTATRSASRVLIDPVHLVSSQFLIVEETFVECLDDRLHVHLHANEDQLLPMIAERLHKVLHDSLDLLWVRGPLVLFDALPPCCVLLELEVLACKG